MVHYKTREDAFWSNVIKTDDCWLWKGYHTHGYAVILFRYEQTVARRYIFAKLKGPLPPKAQLFSSCLNKGCVNPDHLSLTAPEHVLNRDMKGERGPSAKLRTEQVLDIRRRAHSAKHYSQLYNISLSYVYRIWKGENWKHVGYARPTAVQ
jgi:hypothetical protein